MKIKQLLEGLAPKLAKAPSGIMIMTPQQFVAKQNQEVDDESDNEDLDEALKLPIDHRNFDDQEFQDYMKRIVGTPDLYTSGPNAGKPKTYPDKVDKKTGEVIPGKEKYISGKTKRDKYTMPYIHRSSVLAHIGPDGERYDIEKMKAAIKVRPKRLLKENEKMKHSSGELEQFFNIGFAALVGVAVDEETNELIIVNTCPGAGSCKVDCFAMKGGKIQYEHAWLSDARIITYLLNDPDGFYNQLDKEIKKEVKLGEKGGYTVTIRWHDAGDFFSPEYAKLAFKLANANPDVLFYAYTKLAGVTLGEKPANFIINWSEGATTAQTKQVKQNDKDLEKTKNSRIVPEEIFGDLLLTDEKGNLKKGPEGQWQIQPDKIGELKQRLAAEYGISKHSILTYNEYDSKVRGKENSPLSYNVIIAPGEPDITARDHGVLSTLLLRH